MMSLINTIFAIVAVFYLVLVVKRDLQMLQQNSYFPSRYSKFVTDTFVVWLCVLAFVFCISFEYMPEKEVENKVDFPYWYSDLAIYESSIHTINYLKQLKVEN